MSESMTAPTRRYRPQERCLPSGCHFSSMANIRSFSRILCGNPPRSVIPSQSSQHCQNHLPSAALGGRVSSKTIQLQVRLIRVISIPGVWGFCRAIGERSCKLHKAKSSVPLSPALFRPIRQPGRPLGWRSVLQLACMGATPHPRSTCYKGLQ